MIIMYRYINMLFGIPLYPDRKLKRVLRSAGKTFSKKLANLVPKSTKANLKKRYKSQVKSQLQGFYAENNSLLSQAISINLEPYNYDLGKES